MRMAAALGVNVNRVYVQAFTLGCFMAGLGGETVPMAEFDWMAGKLASAVRNGRVEKAAHWVGFED